MQLRKLHSHPAAQGRSPLFAGLPQCSWSSARASARPAPPPRVAFMEPCTSDHNSSSSRRAAAEQALVAAWSTLCAEQEPTPAARAAQQQDEQQERRLAWHEKTMHEWALVEDAAHLASLTSPEAAQDGIIVVEFFSPACLACKGAAPALSKLPQEAALKGRHVRWLKANMEDESLFWWLKRNGVTGLPHMSVFSARTGRRLVGMSCSNKKLPQVKEALRSLLALHRAGHQRFGFTPQGALEALDDAHAAQEPEAPLLAAPGLAAAV